MNKNKKIRSELQASTKFQDLQELNPYTNYTFYVRTVMHFDDSYILSEPSEPVTQVTYASCEIIESLVWLLYVYMILLELLATPIILLWYIR